MRENELLDHVYRRSADLLLGWPAVVVGPGDDCAVIREAGGGLTLLKVDQLVEGRHYRRGTEQSSIARKAIARPLSDIAAMAGVPRAALVAAVLPEDYAGANELFDHLSWASRGLGCPLVGGDIASAPAGSPLVLSVTVVGEPHATRGPVLRHGARPGDGVYVSGRLGGSFEEATGGGRHLTFEPWVELATRLADRFDKGLSAMMDLSDGLGMDGERLGRASGVGLRIDLDRVPRHADARGPLSVLGDGEDYELLFTAQAGMAVPDTLAGVELTRIGDVVEGGGCRVLYNGVWREAGGFGFEHGSGIGSGREEP